MKPEVWEPSFKCCTILTPVLYLERGASSDTLWSQGKLACFRRVYLPFSPGKIKPGKGNGTPLQYPCLENPRDGGAWWAAVYGVTQSRTRLKWLSSSSSSKIKLPRSTSFVLKIQSWFPIRKTMCFRILCSFWPSWQDPLIQQTFIHHQVGIKDWK